MKVYMFSIILLLAILAGCKEEVPPTSSTSGEGGNVFDATNFDYRLVGSWSTSDGTVRRYSCISGIYIGCDRSLQPLGIQLSSGTLAVVQDGEKYLTRLLSANNGLIILEHMFCPGPIETLYVHYRVKEDTLTFLDVTPWYSWVWWMPSTVHRTRLGTNVSLPLQFTFSVKINGVEAHARKVAECPSAYLSVDAPSHITLNASLLSPELNLYIPINGFNGLGTYKIADDQVWFLDYCDDQVQSNYIFDSLSHNTVTITEFDIALNRCSGSFDLDLGICTCIPGYLRFREGVFSVPIINGSQSSQLPEQALRRQTIPVPK